MTPLVLFDLDNTLVDRQDAFLGWAAHFVAARNLPADALDDLRRFDDDGFASRDDVFTSLRQAYDISDTVDQLIGEYRSQYFSYFQPDQEVLAELRRFRMRAIRVGIVTNGPASQIVKIRRSGLIDLVDGYCISEEVGVDKPRPEIFEEAVRRCGGPPSSAETLWMVGDTAETDIAGGANAGMKTIWMSRGRQWPMDEYTPDFVAGDIREVGGIIASVR